MLPRNNKAQRNYDCDLESRCPPVLDQEPFVDRVKQIRELNISDDKIDMVEFFLRIH